MKNRLNFSKIYIADWLLRFGLAITFFWIGLMIVAEPNVWGSYLQQWAVDLLPLPLEQMMTTTGYYDIVTGVLFLIPPAAFIAGLLGASHMVVVLVTSGVNEGTVRDFTVLGGSLAIVALYWPLSEKKKK